MRTRLHADPAGVFVHDAVLAACRQFGERTAVVDTSYPELRRITYAEYGDLVERTACGFVAAGIQPGEVIAIYLPNCWEFAAAYHAATLAAAIPTLLNPSYREREVRYQMENSGAAILITDGSMIAGMDLSGLPALRRIYTTRAAGNGIPFTELLQRHEVSLPDQILPSARALAALPYSSGTTGLPKGVMLSHHNLVANFYQLLAPGEEATTRPDDVVLTFLPLYHIYGLNVLLNPVLAIGATLVLMPRFDVERSLALIAREGVTFVPMVPPVMNAYCLAAEAGRFPREHRVRAVKCGAAPLPADLPRRFRDLTGIRTRQGYGMTEASPVTHLGFLEPELYAPDTIGAPVALTDCRLLDEQGHDVPDGTPGELVMRGPQFMLGYWNAPDATAAVLRPLESFGSVMLSERAARAEASRSASKLETGNSKLPWYFSGDIAIRDSRNFFKIVDRRKEMIKFKGFPIAPAEIEAVLLEHPAVRDCGVVALPDDDAGEVPCAFVVLRDGHSGSDQIARDLSGYVAERLTSYKQPRHVRFVANIPRNPSGKILRRDLRTLL